MKQLALITSAFLLMTSCCKTDDVDQSKINSELQLEIEELYVKVEATEAQLLNVSAELSKCRGNKKEKE